MPLIGAAIAAIYVALQGFLIVASLFSNGTKISNHSFPVAVVLVGTTASCLAAFIGSLAPAIRAATGSYCFNYANITKMAYLTLYA